MCRRSVHTGVRRGQTTHVHEACFLRRILWSVSKLCTLRCRTSTAPDDSTPAASSAIAAPLRGEGRREHPAGTACARGPAGGSTSTTAAIATATTVASSGTAGAAPDGPSSRCRATTCPPGQINTLPQHPELRILHCEPGLQRGIFRAQGHGQSNSGRTFTTLPPICTADGPLSEVWACRNRDAMLVPTGNLDRLCDLWEQFPIVVVHERDLTVQGVPEDVGQQVR
mmetsp:Transcript_23941/g.80832  ORF Transcript_23941/g.80832 Transcript_23941/m.80832 type:complete len:226 (+) Transcript_23941:511-1188(+)